MSRIHIGTCNKREMAMATTTNHLAEVEADPYGRRVLWLMAAAMRIDKAVRTGQPVTSRDVKRVIRRAYKVGASLPHKAIKALEALIA